MRKYILCLSMTLPFVYGFPQSGSFKPVSAYYNPGWANMDYAVPESPAFKMLGTNPDNILHPTSAKNIALSIGNYFVSSGPIIPKSLAVQFSPYLLANNNTSLNEYQKHKFFSRLSFSLGSSTQGSSYAIAEGLNMTVIDKTDLKGDITYLNFLQGLADKITKSFDQAKTIYRQKVDPSKSLADINQILEQDTSNTSSLFKSLDSIATILSGISDNTIVTYRDKYKATKWNAPIWQIGIAVLQSSPDSLVKNLRVTQYGLWSSTGLPVFGSKGQFLFGGKAGLIDSINWKFNYSLGARLFYGTNNFKGFLQGEFDYKNNINNLTFSAGCEFNVYNGIWGQFALNIVIDSMGKLSWQPGFNIGLGSGEKKSVSAK